MATTIHSRKVAEVRLLEISKVAFRVPEMWLPTPLRPNHNGYTHGCIVGIVTNRESYNAKVSGRNKPAACGLTHRVARGVEPGAILFESPQRPRKNLRNISNIPAGAFAIERRGQDRSWQVYLYQTLDGTLNTFKKGR